MEKLLQKILTELQTEPLSKYALITIHISKTQGSKFEYTFMYRGITANTINDFIDRLHAKGYINKDNLIPKKRIKKEVINENKGKFI